MVLAAMKPDSPSGLTCCTRHHVTLSLADMQPQTPERHIDVEHERTTAPGP